MACAGHVGLRKSRPLNERNALFQDDTGEQNCSGGIERNQHGDHREISRAQSVDDGDIGEHIHDSRDDDHGSHAANLSEPRQSRSAGERHSCENEHAGGNDEGTGGHHSISKEWNQSRVSGGQVDEDDRKPDEGSGARRHEEPDGPGAHGTLLGHKPHEYDSEQGESEGDVEG